jgi:small-conductance mechanosensitive channel
MRDALQTVWDQAIRFGLGLIQAIAVLLIAAMLARVVRRPVRGRLSKAFIPENGKTLIENSVSLGIYLLAVTLLLTVWGASWSTLLAAIGVSTLLVALGLQTTLQSFVAGIFILFERPYSVGDQIKFSGHDIGGAVEEIGFRTTIIRSDDGVRIITPNALFFTQAVENHSPDRAIRTVVKVNGVGESDRTSDETRELVEAALVGVPDLPEVRAVTVRSRLEKVKVPGRIARVPRVGGWAERLLQRANEQTTQVRVIWAGSSHKGVREEVVRRLKELFPESSVSVRRW